MLEERAPIDDKKMPTTADTPGALRRARRESLAAP